MLGQSGLVLSKAKLINFVMPVLQLSDTTLAHVLLVLINLRYGNVVTKQNNDLTQIISFSGWHVLGKIALNGVDPLMFAFYREFVGSLAMYGLVRWKSLGTIFTHSNIFPRYNVSLSLTI